MTRARRFIGMVALAAAHVALGGCGRAPVSRDAPAGGGGSGVAGVGGSAGAAGGLAGGPAGQGGQGGSAPAPGGTGGGAAGGVGGTGGAPPPLPAGWTEVAPPPGAAGLDVSDAWAIGPDEIIFIGMLAAPAPYTPRAYRYANGVWNVELELPASDDWSRPSISGTAPDDIWAVGDDQIHHRDASGWSRVADDGWQASVPRPSYGRNAALGMTRVRAAGRDDVWVVGVRDAEFTGGTGFILHRVNGVASVIVLDDPKSTPRIYYDYDDIYIAGANDVWLSGGSDAEGSTMDPSFLYHWDGAAWTIRGHGRFGLVGLWPTGDGGLWLLDPGDWDNSGVVSMARFADDQFSAVPVEGLPRTTALYSIWGAAPDDVWAAGQTVARWDGRSWRVVDDVPAAARPGGGSTSTFVTGDPRSTWLVTSGPRFFRKLRTP